MTTVNKHQVQFLRGLYFATLESDKVKTYFSTMREVTKLDWISTRGIRDQHNGKDFKRYIPNTFLNEMDSANILSYVSDLSSTMTAMLRLAVVCNGILDSAAGTTFFNTVKQSCDLNNTFLESFARSTGRTLNTMTVPEPVVTPVAPAPVAVSEVNSEMIDAAIQKFLDANGINIEVKSQIASLEKDIAERATNLEKGMAAQISRDVKDAVNALRPMVIKIGNKPEVKFEGRAHNGLVRCLQLIRRGKQQVFIAGPAGTGKTTLAAHVSKALGLDFGFVSCNLGMSKAELLGCMDAHGNYIAADFVKLYENGGVFLFDEVDAADANTMLIINSALANGLLSVPARKENQYAARHKDFHCICAANTWGFGSAEYVGRNILDAAFLDRFATSRMIVDYDMDLESAIAGTHTVVTEIVWQMRKNVKENKIKRVVSTRAIEGFVEAIIDGDTITQFVETFTVGWSTEEKAKALQGVKL